jgi:large subunit ribosomal protein L23
MRDKSLFRSSVVTEKAATGIRSCKYTFYVRKKYGVLVSDVNIMVVKGKQKVRGKIVGKRPDRKKAIVTLAKGQEIAEIKELF